MRPKNRFFGLFFIIPLLTHALWAENVGTRGPAILELETGVRAIGMGGAYTAVSDDASALYWNPAGLQQTKQQEVQLMRTDSFVEQTENRVAYTRPTWLAGERKTWGLSVHHLALPDFNIVEENESVGSVRPQEFAVGLSHSRSLFGVACGMSLKWVKTEMFEQSGQTVVADFGILGSHPKGWRWGMALANVGPSMQLGSDKIGLPTTVRGGLSKRLPLRSGEWVAAGDVDYTVEGDPSGRVGLEYNLPVGRDWRVALRSGVRTTEEGRFSFGGGVGRGPLDLNYAFTAFGDLGSTSRIDFTLRFGGELAPEVRRRELLKIAKDSIAKGDLPKARQAVDELKTLSPRSRDVMNLNKQVRLRYSESLDPENLLALGNEALDRRDYQEAVIRFQKLLLVDPTNKEGRALLTRANTLLEKERQDKLKAELTRTREQQKKLWEQDAKFLYSQQEWQSSVVAWQKWVKAGGDPKRGEAEIRRCWDKIYAEAEKALGSGDHEKAIQFFQSVGPGYKDAKERAKAIEKKLQDNRVAMGKMKYEQGMEAYVGGDFKKAKALFEEALAQNPNDLRAQQALNRIREELRPGLGGTRP